MPRPHLDRHRSPGADQPDSDHEELIEIRRMLATTGVERPGGDTATWLWAVLADHAERQSACTCGSWAAQ